MNIEPMKKTDIDGVVWLIANAMNDNEARWARETMQYHFGCRRAQLDDGRQYFLWRRRETITGIVGLHRYVWGPPENVWLAWLAISHSFQRRGYGTALIIKIENMAREQGYKKMFVETYDHPDFDDARAFYSALGYTPMGSIDQYLPDGSPMIVFGKKL